MGGEAQERAGDARAPLEASVVVESYNHLERPSIERVARALGAAAQLVAAHGRAELLLADASGDPALAALAARFPGLRRVEAVGLDYDAAKLRAAAEARGEFVVYLDGDCVPEPGWLEAHLAPLRSGEAQATAGFTRYEGGFRAALQTILDFGFLLPLQPREVGCYASNNAGFRRALLREAPPPPGALRCRCYAHAQLLARRGTPVRLVPEARNRHARVPLLRERFEHGFADVAACWVDPALPEARLLRRGLLAAPFFYARNLRLDRARLAAARQALGLTRAQAAAAALLLPLLRLIDLAGALRALAPGGRASGVGLQGGRRPTRSEPQASEERAPAG
jgi:hypothetical protein